MKRVVLCRPLGPRNVGSVLRVALNFDLGEIVLVAPPKRSLLIHPDFVQMSHGVADVERRIRVVATLDEALADCTGAVGFTARKRGHSRLDDWRDARDGIAERAGHPDELLALVFGSEEGGLTKDEADRLHQLVRIPTGEEHTSLNLAMSVGIVLSTIFFAGHELTAAADSRTPIKGKDREFLTNRARRVLGEAALTDAARRDIVEMVDRVFPRAPLETRDARAWHLLFRAMGDREA